MAERRPFFAKQLNSKRVDCGTESHCGGYLGKSALFFGNGMEEQGNGRRFAPQRLERRRDFPEGWADPIRSFVIREGKLLEGAAHEEGHGFAFLAFTWVTQDLPAAPLGLERCCKEKTDQFSMDRGMIPQPFHCTRHRVAIRSLSSPRPSKAWRALQTSIRRGRRMQHAGRARSVMLLVQLRASFPCRCSGCRFPAGS